METGAQSLDERVIPMLSDDSLAPYEIEEKKKFRARKKINAGSS